MIPMGPLAQINRSFMKDRCRIQELELDKPPGAWNQNTLTYEYGYSPQTLYEGECMIYPNRGAPLEVRHGGQDRVRSEAFLEIPLDSDYEPQVEHVVTYLEVGDEGHQNLVGLQFIVVGFNHDTYASAKVLRVENFAWRPGHGD